ncbi:MAG: carbamate kinase [Lachnospiraceae bacterium]|nr:carbamate kinase [Lachnospiraceae bacterium]
MSNKKKVVVALGHKALGTTLPEQKIATKTAAKAIADLVEAGCQVVISHSNAPQVGMIHTAMNEFGKQHPDYTFAPMSVCSAMSQGYIGYDLQNAIREELLNRGIGRPVSTILTQVVVNPYDDSFYKPVKVVGRVMTREEADAEEEKGNYVTKVDGGYRRIVSAPKPEDIVEIESIRVLSDAGHVVIACGGGGIPVLRQSHHLKGASAVIEKDLASAKLAELLDADMLMILTSEKKLYLNYGKENAEPLDEISVEKARAYIAEGQFDETSVLPKVVAAVSFVSLKPGRVTVIADLDDAKEALEERTGTIIRS